MVASILAHSSTDVLVARWFREEGAKADAVPAAARDRPPAPERPSTTEDLGGGG